jgi:hypothetical protein
VNGLDRPAADPVNDTLLPELYRANAPRDPLAAAERFLRETAGQAADALADAVASLYDAAIDRMLASPHRVRSAAEGRGLLATDEGGEALADQVQRVAVIAVPLVRTFARRAWMPRVPWALVASTTISIGVAVRMGVREVRVLGSLLAHRIEEATGQPADPDLVKKLAIELYLSPKRRPDLRDPGLRAGRLVRRWVLRGALGRETGKAASKALEAAERLDVRALAAEWARTGARPAGRSLSAPR